MRQHERSGSRVWGLSVPMIAALGLAACGAQQRWTEADVYQEPEPTGARQQPAASKVSVWVTGPSHKVLRAEPSPPESVVWDDAQGRVRLHAARNEFVSFQIVYAGRGKGLSLETQPLTGADRKLVQRPRAYREHFVPTPVMSQYSIKNVPWDCMEIDMRCGQLDAPREFPVQLVPLDAPKHGAPFDVTDAGNEVVWVDYFVPEGTAPGTYRGTIVTAGRTLQVELEVWNFTLPSVSHFPSWAYAGPEEIAWSLGRTHQQIPQMQKAFDAYFQLAHDHRLVLMEGFHYDEAYVKGPERRYFDYYTGAAFKGPFGAGFGFELLPTEPSFGKLIEQSGWLNRAFVILEDEPGSRQQYLDVLRKGKAIREAPDAVGLRRMVTEQYTPTEPGWPHLDSETDIFCSGAIHPDQVKPIETRQNAVWTYNRGHAGAPYVDAPGPAMRTHAWAGFLTGARAWYFWGATYVVDLQNKWRKNRDDVRKNPVAYRTDLWNDPLTFDEAKRLKEDGSPYPVDWALRLNGDGVLIYPGTEVGIDGPLPGFRLKNLRQGAQDFEYLYLLEKMGKREEAEAIAKALMGTLRMAAESSDGQAGTAVFGYELDGAKWDEARIRLGKILHAIGEQAIRAAIQPYNQYPNPVGHPSMYGGARY